MPESDTSENSAKDEDFYGYKHEDTDILFLFGAGASIDAGVPGTYRFVGEFQKKFQKSSKEYELLKEILEIRREFNALSLKLEKTPVDVEQLLETFHRLVDKDKEILLRFYMRPKFRFTESETQCILKLKQMLETFIREKVIADKENLEYLTELLKFEQPLEIFTTNYDTCIEQLCHMNFRKYTDGFNPSWDRESFNGNFDVKHYKMHGSVIWYENKKTKECLRIPVHTFIEGKPANLRTIFGEDVEPLLLYPGQKSEYVEPLTELQLMFKDRLLQRKGVKILIIVGYSFRDAYIIHMLWDAARANKDLHIVLIDPNALQHFNSRLKFIEKDEQSLSRLHDRVVCLPYPFGTIIHRLKNHYLSNLRSIIRSEIMNTENERLGITPDWEIFLRLCIDSEFFMKMEYVLENKIRKEWDALQFASLSQKFLYEVKAMLHFVAAQGNFYVWMKRANKSLNFLALENFRVSCEKAGLVFFFQFGSNRLDYSEISKSWIKPVLLEYQGKLNLLGSGSRDRFSKIQTSFDRLEKLNNYLVQLEGRVRWQEYLELRSGLLGSRDFTTLLNEHKYAEAKGFVLEMERRVLKEILKEKVMSFAVE